MADGRTSSGMGKAREGKAVPAALSRRQALAKLGIAAAIVYTAPTVLHLDRSANAFILPTPCKGKGKGKGKGKRPCIPRPRGKGKGKGWSGSGYRGRPRRRP